ncbi:hypothetical protein K2X33_14715 [bacterium]|nr:hypothetical protein [bacterium]
MKLIYALVFLTLSGHANAHEGSSSSIDPSQFEIEENLVEKIYQQNAQAAKLDINPRHSDWLVSSSFSLFSPKTFVLSNPYFDVDYGRNLGTLPTVRLELAAPILSWKTMDLLLLGRIAYSYRESLYSVRSKSGTEFKDLIRLHWLPASFGGAIEAPIPYLTFIRPRVGGGVGLQWIYQQGRLDGLEQGFWIPFSYLEASVSLFASKDWFGGLKGGVTWLQSMAGAQGMSGWSLDLGVEFHL